MNAQSFDKPVAVLVGLGFVRVVPTVMAAYEMVAEWPASPRSLPHAAALDACRAALNGEGKPEDAHAAFLRFAEHTGILMDDTAAMLPAATQATLRRAPGLN
ncbi:DUF982 domain-containing protein [Tianweitania sp. BSSL-BM11]|uniref:DUF982 domain-containing protein n=1 Tax=Tianweitania aestuarii TaxID=2814886 RepID=A0ABS5RQY4_9HYPH|nr:DUF982 domain-containing protein [Tianweitania aestuarii]MBS9719411.1 DUF982 domain-containing protein [Tianweitania aestuarii]